jgi:hypothetical protein
MKRILLFILGLTFSFNSFSGEGMWLPLLLDKYNIGEMQEKGFRLSADDIYDINRASMKDAVVRIGGCTGVVVSGQGLVLTNHHCAYRSIQSHSDVDNDYLTDGFWAMTTDEELPDPGLTVTFLVRMEDVTERVMSALHSEMNEEERLAAVRNVSADIRKNAVEGTRYHADVNSFYYGSEYYLFVYDIFNDIRLVGAPPSSIGKFGGDTDNWMWPRHTGDFAWFRIYADGKNQPAGYSADNVPYQSPAFIPVSTRGVNEGDFTMVLGFPGSTSQYLTSHAVRNITGLSNPHKIDLRGERLAIMEDGMRLNDTIRIKYASKYASVSNAWKRWQGENRGLAKLDAVSRKRTIEKEFAEWIENDPERHKLFAHVLPSLDSLYTRLGEYVLPYDYGSEALYAIETVRFVNDFLVSAKAFLASGKPEKPRLRRLITNQTDNFFRDYYLPVDREIFITMLEMYRDNIDNHFHPAFFKQVETDFNSDFGLYARHVYGESIFSSKNRVLALLDMTERDAAKQLENDIFVGIVRDINAVNNNVSEAYNRINDLLIPLYRRYVEGLRMMDPGKVFYPDANRTLRVSYGQVKGYVPRDAVYYSNFTTLSGVMEKNSTGTYDYIVPERLKWLYESRDYGPWAIDGEMRVGFIASNHTTGGNSGSPVINGDGHLVGVNFDRAWEGTMSDIMFDPDRCRNISVDINYILFITDRFAGAGHLLDEMTILR